MRRSSWLLVLAGAVAADLALSPLPRASAPRSTDAEALAARAVPIDLTVPYDTNQYEFLRQPVANASIVQLGESIHVTSEFPRARLRLVRFLHEQMGFDTVALEGSLTQAWLAQEHLYRSTASPDIRIDEAQRIAWFKLWNTHEMRELMAYVDEARQTSRPLYLTSFDVQTGASAEFGMTPSVLHALGSTLSAFGAPKQTSVADLVAALTPVVQCPIGSADGLGPAKERAHAAVDAIDAWISSIVDEVSKARPPTHVAALRLIPDNLRDHVALCEQATNWQRVRDELNADNAVALLERVSISRKLIAWAHHSHVSYNTERAAIPSMGQHLRQKFGEKIYTIGLFAGGGRFVDVAPLSVHHLPSVATVGVERLLDAAGPSDYFIDLATLPQIDSAAGWLVPQTSRAEGRRRAAVVLARDFDGALYLREVHPGTGMVPPGPFRVLQIFGVLVDHLMTSVVVVLAILVKLGAFMWQRAVRRQSLT